MTKKERLLSYIKESCAQEGDYFSVLVETRGSKGLELIVNPFCNRDEKIAYYDKSYNDDLTLKAYDGIKIVSWDSCGGNCRLEFLMTPYMLEEEE